MDLALTLLVIWGLLFMPVGIMVHWLVLGEGSRVRALVIAPVTGIAAALVTLGALGRIGIDAGDDVVVWSFVALAVVCAVAIWRLRVPWYSRELGGAALLLLFAVLLIQLCVIGADGSGPLGYGTTVNPVAEVAAIDAAAHGPASDLAVARAARATADERPIGFEQFAALTVALGLDSDPSDARTPEQARNAEWTAYGLHAAITAMFAALITLPIFAFARARGVRWFGLIVLVPLGVLAPALFLALANGEGAAVASVPFTTAAVFSLLVTRRDRGWWALVILYGAAVAATAGPIALLPLVVIGLAWMLLRSNTYEHLSQHDAPVRSERTLVFTFAAFGLGVAASLPLLRGGELLAWEPLHTRLADTIRSWPFAWLDSNLTAAGPEGPLETAIWLVGPALLAVALIYAVVRNERRELGVLAGALAAGIITGTIGLLDPEAGIRLFEFTMLSVSPFLAALAIRAVSLARENASEHKGTRHARLAGTGPTVLVVTFVLLSYAATAATGTRMVHAPSVTFGDAASRAATTLIAAGDPWLEFVVDGERVRGGYADADAVAEARNGLSDRGIRTEGYDQVILSSSPLSSDPTLRYLERSKYDQYQVRLFVDRVSDAELAHDLTVDPARLEQRARTQTADRPGAESTQADETEAKRGGGAKAGGGDAADEVATSLPKAFSYTLAEAHTPVEGNGVNTPPDRPAGLLVPSDDVKGCEARRDVLVASVTCEPEKPVRGADCSAADVAAARSPLDRKRTGGQRTGGTNRVQVLTTDSDVQLSKKPTMIGVECFDVPLRKDSAVLMVHLRDVGLVIPPEDATATGADGADSWTTERERGREGGNRGIGGGTRRVTSALDASLRFGRGELLGGYDLVLEGSFGAGVAVSTDVASTRAAEDTDTIQLPATEVDTLRGSADGFSEILRGKMLSGVVNVTNRAGTVVEIGRLFARPRDLPRSCDVPIALAEDEQREVRVESPDVDSGAPEARPGLTVSIVRMSGTGADRVAHVAVANYLSRAGLPRHVLIDWTEQYEDELQVEGCDGATYTEPGVTPVDGDTVLGVEDALGSLADQLREVEDAQAAAATAQQPEE